MKQLVFSLDRPNNPATELDVQVVTGLLNQAGLSLKPVLSVYKGIAEKSWIVVVETIDQERLVRSIANHYNQESLLSINSKSLEVTLLNLKGRPKKVILGHWIKTNKINKAAMTLDLTSLDVFVIN